MKIKTEFWKNPKPKILTWIFNTFIFITTLNIIQSILIKDWTLTIANTIIGLFQIILTISRYKYEKEVKQIETRNNTKRQ